MDYRKLRNNENAKYCKGCAWLHIGKEVDHNHCDYTCEDYDDCEKRANGQLIGLSPKCRWFWAEKLNSDTSHGKEGIFYKPPIGSCELCPQIPKDIINGKRWKKHSKPRIL